MLLTGAAWAPWGMGLGYNANLGAPVCMLLVPAKKKDVSDIMFVDVILCDSTMTILLRRLKSD